MVKIALSEIYELLAQKELNRTPAPNWEPTHTGLKKVLPDDGSPSRWVHSKYESLFKVAGGYLAAACDTAWESGGYHAVQKVILDAKRQHNIL